MLIAIEILLHFELVRKAVSYSWNNVDDVIFSAASRLQKMYTKMHTVNKRSR